MIRVLVLAGTAQGNSPAAALAGAAARELALASHAVTRLSLADYRLPVAGGERADGREPPEAAIQLARQLQAHDAAVVVAPGHRGGVPPLLGNALDWIAHPRAGADNAFGEDRVFALAAAGDRDGATTLAALRQMLTGFGALVVPEQLVLSGADRAFDGMGALADPADAAQLRRLLEATTRRAALLRRGAR